MDIQRRVLKVPATVIRAADTAPRISGYAAMYNVETIVFGLWREQVAPGAFKTALDGADDVRALFNHDTNILLGRTKSGTLKLSDDAKGLKYEVTLDPDDPDSARVHSKIKRGDVDGSSFGFTIEDEEWDERPTKEGKLPLVTIRKVTLYDVSPVTFPAYPQTSVSARSRGEALQAEVSSWQARRAEMMVSDRLSLRVRLELARAWQG
jgi:uncharacterized protein